MNTKRKLTPYGQHSGGMWVYCGTYHKYNSGSIEGAWIYLADFTDKDDFLSYCRELHKDEHDPELMFQDIEGIPSSLASESHVDAKCWELLEFSDDEQEIILAYLKECDEREFQDILDNYRGTFRTVEDYAYEFVNDCYDLEKAMGNLANYFDYEAFARDMQLGGDITVIEGGEGVMIFGNF